MAANRSAVIRIAKEVGDIQKGSDLSLAVLMSEEDAHQVKALIVGPPGTPYEYGFFEFQLVFPDNYPTMPPFVKCLTTGEGRTRFNPNVYAGGKVCLSILGTWRGRDGENWSSAQGLESVLLSIQSLLSSNPFENEPGYEPDQLLYDETSAKEYVNKITHETIKIAVIQRLEKYFGLYTPIQKKVTHPSAKVFKPTPSSTQPMSMEAKASSQQVGAAVQSSSKAQQSGSVNQNTTSVTSETSLKEKGKAQKFPPQNLWLAQPKSSMSKLKDEADDMDWNSDLPKMSAFRRAIELRSEQLKKTPFMDLCKQRFSWYFTTYLNTVEAEIKKHELGEPFRMMSFERQDNSMSGVYAYPILKNRLLILKEKLILERLTWVKEGLELHSTGEGNYLFLQGEYERLVRRMNEDVVNVSLELEHEHPYIWRMMLFGKPMSKLDGGIFHFNIYFSPRFPAEQPRVVLLTPIFHHRITEDGTVCYFVRKSEDIGAHLEAIIEAIEQEDPPYDPRAIVRPEASKLLWGTAEDKKQYNRKLRRSIEQSAEL